MKSDYTKPKRVAVRQFYENTIKGSNLEKIVFSSPLPLKCTIEGIQCYYYNPGLYALMTFDKFKDDLDQEVHTYDFEKEYSAGFQIGLKSLKKEYGIRKTDFHDPAKQDLLKERINYILHEREYINGQAGLLRVKTCFPPVWIEGKNIYDHGKHNGLLHSIALLEQNFGKDFIKPQEDIADPGPQSNIELLPSKADRINEAITEYGFFELDKIKQLSAEGRKEIITLIAKHKVPYQIAMLDFLGFISSIELNYFKTKGERDNSLNKMLLHNNPRHIKGNILVLDEYSKEDRTRYTAHKHKEIVQEHYHKLK